MLFGYVALHAIVMMYDPGRPDLMDQMIIKTGAATNLTLFFMFAIIALKIKTRELGYSTILMQFLCVVASIATIIHPAGLFGNPSINASVLVMTMAFLPIGLTIIPTLAIIASGSLMAIGGLGIFLLKRYSKVEALAVLGLVPIAYVFFPNMTTGRVAIWRDTIEYTLKNGTWFGLGPGTASVFLPLIQQENHAVKDIEQWYLQAHSDYVQMFLEHGLIGIIIMVFFVACLLWNSRKNEKLFTATTLCVLMCAGNSMTAFPVQALVLGIITMLVYKQKKIFI